MLGGGDPNGDGDGELIGEGEGPPKPCAPVSQARRSLERDDPPFPLRDGGCFFFSAAGSEVVVSPSNWSK